ncbi:helix-turn-helix domain-containing protein [Paraburkholderia hospita]|uniref:helix-turn-helix domain-containing protein n=1 Tax=Paraburkholderia hospita TaxID=169430 RepID=UPI0009D09F10|nr:helix-turn-helix transcriptional regulator [Paraburkholderia hospita]SKC93236.1 Helix-turn-helix [Paraburkholderia hospita]
MKIPNSPWRARTPEELEAEVGRHLKTLRVHKNLDQATVAARAGISVRSLRNLESGSGSSMRTLILVLRALGRETWLDTIAPVPTINPSMLTRMATPRQRASKPRAKKPD